VKEKQDGWNCILDCRSIAFLGWRFWRIAPRDRLLSFQSVHFFGSKMTLFPAGIRKDVLHHYLARLHHKHWRTRIISAFVLTCLIFVLEGWIAGGLAIIWCVVTGCVEYQGYQHRLSQVQSLETASQSELDRVLADLIISISVISACYGVAVIALTFAGQNGRVLGLLLATSLLMNIASQHVIHPRLIVFSLPIPALAFLLSVFSLTDVEAKPWVLWLIGVIYIIQTVLLTWTATRTDTALIDARKAAQDEALARGQADHANEVKTNFLANMSHELRTPLNAVIGYGEILKENAEFEGRRSDVDDIDKVLVSGRRLLQLVGEILDISKITAGGLQLDRRTFDVAQELEMAVAMAGPMIKANNNVLSTSIAQGLGLAVSDPLRFSQCVQNLLSNAAKFTHQGSIFLEAGRHTSPTGDVIVVSVSDTGIGIAPEQLGRLFTPFTQVDDSPTRAYDGAGLGLALTRALARLMGGDVSVTSELGKGSRFTLTILVGGQADCSLEQPLTSRNCH
jgi:signal transduction histidine kinase